MNVFVHRSNNKNIAYLYYNKKKIMCFVGKNGIGKKCREGDFMTPKGIFKMNMVFFRGDKIKKIKSRLPLMRIKKNFAWCVDSRNIKYNSFFQRTIKCKHEDLHRLDDLYDIIIVINYNFNPTIKYKGSAIFIHCSDKKTKYTEGCLAIKKEDLLNLIQSLSPGSQLIIN